MLDIAHQANVAFSYASGKVILVGEHAVVYGARAIALPIDQGVRVAVSRQHDACGRLGPMIRGMGPFFLGDAYIDKDAAGPKVLKLALAYVAEIFQRSTQDMIIIVDGSLPPGCGLGSSAALSVALIKAIFCFLAKDLSDSELRTHALALETIFHGRPSGIDHTVVIDQQVIGFQRNDDKTLCWPIPLSGDLSLAVGIAGPHEGTKNMVRDLAERKKRQEKAYVRLFEGLDQVATEMEKALIAGHRASVGEMMNIAQGYLNALSVSTPEIEKLCAIARDRGALGAKLTGAGGGGAVIALCDGTEQEVANAFRAAGYQSFITQVAKARNP